MYPYLHELTPMEVAARKMQKRVLRTGPYW